MAGSPRLHRAGNGASVGEQGEASDSKRVAERITDTGLGTHVKGAAALAVGQDM